MCVCVCVFEEKVYLRDWQQKPQFLIALFKEISIDEAFRVPEDCQHDLF